MRNSKTILAGLLGITNIIIWVLSANIAMAWQMLALILLFGAIIWIQYDKINKYKTILKQGQNLDAILVSCKEHIKRYDGISYTPIVSMEINGGIRSIELLGIFRSTPCKIGEPLEVMFLDEFSEVVLPDKTFYEDYKMHFITADAFAFTISTLLVFIKGSIRF